MLQSPGSQRLSDSRTTTTHAEAVTSQQAEPSGFPWPSALEFQPWPKGPTQWRDHISQFSSSSSGLQGEKYPGDRPRSPWEGSNSSQPRSPRPADSCWGREVWVSGYRVDAIVSLGLG